MPRIQEASRQDAHNIMSLAKANRSELGNVCHNLSWLVQRIDRGEILVAKTAEDTLIGFVCFTHDLQPGAGHTNVYYMCTDSAYRRRGVGKLLMEAVAVDARLCGNTQITLKCPTHLPANRFYRSIGFELLGEETDAEGGHLNLYVMLFSRDP